MHKLLYFATIGLLAFSIGGCGGDEGTNTASPSPSPSAASPSPAASASPTPAAQAFPSPIVAAQPPGLIRSTNPDERARQAQTNIGDNQDRNPTLPLQPVPQGPVTANPSQLDPFGPLPPIVLQIPPGANGAGGTTSEIPKLPQRQVAVLPELPELLAPPPINRPNQTVTIPRSPGGRGGTQQVRGPGGSLLPGGDGAQIDSRPIVPGGTPPRLGGGGRNGSLPGGTGGQIGLPPLVPGLNAPQLGRTRTSPPGLEPIAARPIGVPNLPELPVDKRPPQWVDPNPPPPPVIPVIPPPPSTDLATGTEVSGVVKVGNETQVIVKVPNEPTSRYVKVGQRLSNGQVLVKRVDLKQGADPIVILEENGVEVAKGVGEKPASRQPQPANAVISRLPNPNSSARR